MRLAVPFLSFGFGGVRSLVESAGTFPPKATTTKPQKIKNHTSSSSKSVGPWWYLNLHSSRSLRRIFPLHIQTATMVTSDSDFTIQLQDSRDVQMYFEVEKSGILQAVFHQYSKIEGVPREFNRLAI